MLLAKEMMEVCKHEAYRPEDHMLTVEEMWGSEDEDGDIAQVKNQSVYSATPTQAGFARRWEDEQALTAEEMWGAASDDDAGERDPQNPKIGCKKGQLVGATSMIDSRGPSAEERLDRMLAGPEASRQLRELSFEELGAVADDCQKAVETLRWVLRQQHSLLLGKSASSGLE